MIAADERFDGTWPMSRGHRVVVPDHMGFGKSETPEDRTYDASERISKLE